MLNVECFGDWGRGEVLRSPILIRPSDFGFLSDFGFRPSAFPRVGFSFSTAAFSGLLPPNEFTQEDFRN
jgi:hypothetical protein